MYCVQRGRGTQLREEVLVRTKRSLPRQNSGAGRWPCEYDKEKRLSAYGVYGVDGVCGFQCERGTQILGAVRVRAKRSLPRQNSGAGRWPCGYDKEKRCVGAPSWLSVCGAYGVDGVSGSRRERGTQFLEGVRVRANSEGEEGDTVGTDRSHVKIVGSRLFAGLENRTPAQERPHGAPCKNCWSPSFAGLENRTLQLFGRM